MRQHGESESRDSIHAPLWEHMRNGCKGLIRKIEAPPARFTLRAAAGV